MSVKVQAPPPPAAIGQGGGDSGWRELITAANDIEAHLLAGRLTESDIDTRMIKDRSTAGAWLYGGSDPWAPSTIFVRGYDYEHARIVLAEISLEGPDAEAPSLRAAGSPRRAAVAWWIAALALGAFFTGGGLARMAAIIDDCGIPIICTERSSP